MLRRCAIFFFFQAEDGIRDVAVTGVQTCALPIFQPRYDDLTLTAVGPCVTTDRRIGQGRSLRATHRCRVWRQAWLRPGAGAARDCARAGGASEVSGGWTDCLSVVVCAVARGELGYLGADPCPSV